MSRRKSKSLPVNPVGVRVESLSHDGRGVAHVDGKAVFIEGALPGEEIRFVYLSRRRKFDEGRVVEVLMPSADRVQPRCPHFGICGGCSLQHMTSAAQVAAKQQVLLDNLKHIGAVQPQQVLEPLHGPQWGYRHKARLGVKYVIKKGRVLVGFRERHKPYIADLTRCEVLHPTVGSRITELADLISGLSVRDRLPQIEVAAGGESTALVFRHLEPLNENDRRLMMEFGRNNDLHVYSQPGGADTVVALWPEQAQLSYGLPEYDIRLNFQPTDFIQINPDINAAMVHRASDYLEPGPDDRVLDLFCGVGNFSLPLARQAGEVVGVDGDAELIGRARENAVQNRLDNVRFHNVDLTGNLNGSPWANSSYTKVLLDPPRSGAKELMPWISKWNAQRVVYVSCHPGSLARDTGILVHEHGYRLLSAGVMDMFPHTAHVESIAVLEK